MAKAQTEVAKYTPQELNDFLNDIMLGKTTPISYQEIFSLLENTPDEQLQELTGEILTFETGQSYNLVFEGFDVRTIKGKQAKIAKLRTKDGEPKISSSTVLVNSLSGVEQLPIFVRINCKGKKSSSAGEYFDLEVKTFPMSN